tara:strand:- start:3120 stop:3329 length:210 start_codon:yes stop_codon:yes gene_type:complete
MSWLQIAAVTGVAVFVLVRLNVWQYIKPSKKSKQPLKYTLEELAPRCDAIEDFKAWKRLIDLVAKNEAD